MNFILLHKNSECTTVTPNKTHWNKYNWERFCVNILKVIQNKNLNYNDKIKIDHKTTRFTLLRTRMQSFQTQNGRSLH